MKNLQFNLYQRRIGWGRDGAGQDGFKKFKPIPAPSHGAGSKSCPIPVPPPLQCRKKPARGETRRGGAKLPSLLKGAHNL